MRFAQMITSKLVNGPLFSSVILGEFGQLFRHCRLHWIMMNTHLVALAVVSCWISAVSGQDITTEEFSRLSQEKQIKVLQNSVERFQSDARRLMLEAKCSIRERNEMPLNYGQSSPTEGLKWGVDHRSIEYQVRYDGVHGWDMIDCDGRYTKDKREQGQNGTKAITIATTTVSSINCDESHINGIPSGIYSHPLQVLYYHTDHDQPTSYLLETLGNAIDVTTESSFSGQPAVEVRAP
jgi:hypothetical protein